MKKTAFRSSRQTWRDTSLRRCAMLAGCSLLLSGCGAWQSVKDTSSDVAQAVFVTRVTTMNLVINARAELNRDARGESLPVVVRIYQLKNANTFRTSAYAQFLRDADGPLKPDTVQRKDITLGPGESITLSTPMRDGTNEVGLVALFREPTQQGWRLVIPVSQWKHTDPVHISLLGNQMEQEQ